VQDRVRRDTGGQRRRDVFAEPRVPPGPALLERADAEEEGRERVKVVEREDMLKASEPDKA